jgi:hypothetical protein
MTGTAVPLRDIESGWREFDARLGAFNDKIEDQKARLVQEIDNKVKSLNTDIEKMYDKWQEKKPKDRNKLTYEDAIETADMMRQLQADWSVISERFTKVQRDCKHFGREMPVMSYYDKMKEELEESNKTWGLFEEFKKGTDEFRKEEWLTFRKKEFFRFQDFFLKFAENLNTMPKSVVTRFLLQQIDGFKQAWPLIKLCVGEAFEKIHWRQLIGML